LTDLIFTNRKTGLPRPIGGAAALTYPLGLTVIAVNQGFGRDSPAGIATAFLAAILLLMATPTAWIFVFDFIDVSPFTAVAVGVCTSLPLWYLAGAALADASGSWGQWSRRYVTLATLWTALNLLVLVLIGGF
jgi:hypothetical protein